MTASTDARRDALVALSHAVHADAEIALRGAHLVAAGRRRARRRRVRRRPRRRRPRHRVHRHASATGDLHVGICAEYDALPGIGHACGHNIIAAAAAGAGLALAEVADELDLDRHRASAPRPRRAAAARSRCSTPGLFEDVHAAMMVHPAPYEAVTMPCLAVRHLEVAYAGRSAHASAYPQLGINAADALTVAQVAIGLLRQHIAPTRPHPRHRHPRRRRPQHRPARDRRPLVRACRRPRGAGRARTARRGLLRGGRARRPARRSTCAATTTRTREMREDPRARRASTASVAEELGRRFPPADEAEQLAGSTDMANVSLRLPTIHPMIAIDAGGAVNHQPEFTAACVTASADAAVRDGALAMAHAAAHAATDDGVRARLLADASTRPSTRWNRARSDDVTRDLDQVRDRDLPAARRHRGRAGLPRPRLAGRRRGGDARLRHRRARRASPNASPSSASTSAAAAERSPAVRGALQLTLLTAGHQLPEGLPPTGGAPRPGPRRRRPDGRGAAHRRARRAGLRPRPRPARRLRRPPRPGRRRRPSNRATPRTACSSRSAAARIRPSPPPSRRGTTRTRAPSRSTRAGRCTRRPTRSGCRWSRSAGGSTLGCSSSTTAGAINGHVPITAIVASICAVAAAALGRGAVLLSNERSADEPTRRLADRDVNHQYSKSSAFERLHVAAARRR